MKKKILSGCMVLFLFCITMSGCTSKDSIVGTWHELGGDDVIIFYDDGTCTNEDEIANYKQQEDGTLMITWGVFKNEIIAKRTDDKDQALEDDEYYYLSGNTLVLSKVECEKR